MEKVFEDEWISKQEPSTEEHKVEEKAPVAERSVRKTNKNQGHTFVDFIFLGSKNWSDPWKQNVNSNFYHMMWKAPSRLTMWFPMNELQHRLNDGRSRRVPSIHKGWRRRRRLRTDADHVERGWSGYREPGRARSRLVLLLGRVKTPFDTRRFSLHRTYFMTSPHPT